MSLLARRNVASKITMGVLVKPLPLLLFCVMSIRQQPASSKSLEIAIKSAVSRSTGFSEVIAISKRSIILG